MISSAAKGFVNIAHLPVFELCTFLLCTSAQQPAQDSVYGIHVIERVETCSWRIGLSASVCFSMFMRLASTHLQTMLLMVTVQFIASEAGHLLDHYAKHQRRLQMLMSMALQKA